MAASALAAAAARARAQRPAMWTPKVGILVNYTPGNVAFAKQEGFTSIGFWAQAENPLPVDRIRDDLKQSGLYCSVLGVTANHIDPDPAKRKAVNDHVAKIIEAAGQLGVPNIGTMSGKDPAKKLDAQVDEIRRVYEERYFPLCEMNKVRLIWEPWPEGPNVATGPVGYEALFRAFGNSPYVGIQFDPSHYVRQFMDPYQAARDWADHIYDVHLKDTEIKYQVLQRTGINPPAPAQWWRYRIPGQGQIDWPKFFTVLMDKGYPGAMNIEHEDDLYRPGYNGNEINEGYKTGFRMGLRFLRQFVPV
jgi:sugar phosphate isomerase/epimerase